VLSQELVVYGQGVLTPEEMSFVDRVARLYARHYHLPPVAGRIVGYLLVSEPAEPTINDLAEELLCSRSAISGAVRELEAAQMIERRRAAGERVDRVSLSKEVPGFDATRYRETADLARQGLALVKGRGTGVSLGEVAALNDFLAERLPKLMEEWRAYRSGR
jgi:DNA-binding transcriptional regulator YhcF (GntR family)